MQLTEYMAMGYRPRGIPVNRRWGMDFSLILANQCNWKVKPATKGEIKHLMKLS